MSTTEMPHIKNYAMLFKTWMNSHGFNFTEHEYLNRLENFIVNDKFIDETNAQKLSYTVGHNEFSHMTSDEFASSMLCTGIKSQKSYLRGDNLIHSYTSEDVMSLPSNVDWRNKNAVSEVKNQGSCGSCWSFSTTGGLEGIYSITNGKLVSFSEQQLVDCDHNGDHACNGGLMTNAFDWIKQNKGLCTEEDYPYFSGDTKKAGTCQTTCKNAPNSDLTGYTEVRENDKNALMTALAKQPVSVAIQANQPAFQLYKSGVFSAKCGDDLDHGVLAVGYDSTGSDPYWIVKNSWGSSWGMNGYILLAMNVDQASGQCGIYGMSSYPNL
jgi:C1A family cysteine protease